MSIKLRLYEDYLKTDRLPEYRKVLEAFHEAGYQMIGILDLYKMINRGGITGKILINRHDIDTSPKVARKMFEIEKAVYGKEGTATYYFRDSTIDKHLIQDIDAFGYETGYHYEEIATLEKKKKTKSIDGLMESLPECRDLFLKDLEQFRRNTGSPSMTVASHGDFINVKYKLQNYELLKDYSIREKSGIIVEAYDECIMKYIESRYADQVLLSRFADEVIRGITEGYNVIMILTHPRNWKVDVIANTRENIVRFRQGYNYNK